MFNVQLDHYSQLVFISAQEDDRTVFGAEDLNDAVDYARDLSKKWGYPFDSWGTEK